MPKIIKYIDAYEPQWTSFIQNCPHANIAHLPGWKEIIEEGLGHKSRYLIALDGDCAVGVLPLFLIKTWTMSRYLVSIPWIDYGGVCAKDLETEKLLLDAAREIAVTEKAKYIEYRSVNVSPALVESPGIFLRKDKVTFILELDKDPEVVMRKIEGQVRTKIRKAEKNGLTIEFGGIEKLRDFYNIFTWKMRDLGTPVWGIAFFERLFKVYPEAARVAMIRKDGKYIAGGLSLAFKDTVYVPSSASYSDYLQFSPNHALNWGIIKDACERGFKYYDFGRSSWDSPTFKFKIQWAHTPQQLTWQYHLNTAKTPPDIANEKQKFEPLIAIWKKLPLPVTRMLGPRVIKNFP